MKTEIRFDDVIHSPIRLRICGILRKVDEAEFSTIRDTLDVGDVALSKNLKVLADAGYVKLSKERAPGAESARRRTWVSLTKPGKAAVESHLAALAAIASGG